MHTKHVFFLLFLVTVVVSCNKQPLMDEHPEFAGTWLHHPYPGENNYLYINADGTGSVAFDDYNGQVLKSKNRKWFWKKNTLYLGKVGGSKRFSVDLFPTTADSSFVSGIDTVAAGDVYVVLSNSLFVRKL